MIYISAALVIIAAMAFYLINKFLDKKFQISNVADKDATIAALQEQIHKFDERLNNTWAAISSTKEELNGFKLAMGLKGMK